MKAAHATAGHLRTSAVRRWCGRLLAMWVLTVLLPVALPDHQLPAAGAEETRPVIQVRPNPLLDSREARVFGRDFCPDAGCSPVDVTLAGRLVAEDVGVGPDGAFAVDILVQTMPGQHELVASQQLADGSTQSARETVVVPARDYVEDSPLPSARGEGPRKDPADDGDAGDDAGSDPEAGEPHQASAEHDDTPTPVPTGAEDEQVERPDDDTAERSPTAMEPAGTEDMGRWWPVSLAVVLVVVAGLRVWRRAP